MLIFQNIVLKAQTNHIGIGDTLQKNKPTESFYDKDASSRWVRELKNIIVIPPKNESVIDSFNVQSPSNIYIGTEGLTISQIRIIRLDPFGTSITDSTEHNVNWLNKAGNAIHISTREFIIRNALLFKEGDIINSYRLADTERYLRSLRYIGDARVTATPVSDNEANVTVIIQDILPYSLSFGTNFSSQANFAVTNRNIIGLGVDLRVGAFINSYKDRLMGYEATLRLPNIGNSFVSFQADYVDRYENQLHGLTLQREFYAPTTKYAGHLILYNARTPVRYFTSNGTYSRENPLTVRYHYLDTWLGRSFQIDKNPFNKQRKNITVSMSAQQIRFIDRPENSEELYYKFQNRTTYLASLAYSQQAFYKTNLIYNFGRTEDIPYGYLLSISGGKEINELYNRPYLGTNVSAGYFLQRFGYVSGAFSYGSFFHHGADQGALDFELNYFTPLYVIGNYRHRTFVNGQYTRQLYNRLDDQLVIDGEYGIPGFRNDSVLGRHRLNLSVEQVLFTPWDLFGFRFVIYAFTHLSWLGGYDRSIILSPLYSSFGIGVRIRNNRLIFNTLQIRLAYFPNIPKYSRFRYIEFSKESLLLPRDFMPKAPGVLPVF